MLKYQINKSEVSDDRVMIQYESFITETHITEPTRKMYVTFKCLERQDVLVGDKLDIVDNGSETDKCFKATVLRIDTLRLIDNDIVFTFTIEAPLYEELPIDSIYDIKDPDTGDRTWMFRFSDSHKFSSSEDGNISLVFNYINKSEYSVDGLSYFDEKTLTVPYNPTHSVLEGLLFTTSTPLYNFELQDGSVFRQSNTVSLFRAMRTQSMFSTDSEYGTYLPGPSVYKDVYKLSIDIPIETKNNIKFDQELLVKEKFINTETDNAINSHIELEKHIYYPTRKVPVLSSNGQPLLNEFGEQVIEYKPISKINFNLHFRDHSGENWTVDDTSTWNCMKTNWIQCYNESKKSNQSDLLGYLGFKNSDIKYQKNVLKKSFLRIMLYDSVNVSNQNLLGYYTLYFDTNKLYSKYIRTTNLKLYQYSADDRSEDLSNGAKVDNEVHEETLKTIRPTAMTDNSVVEDYRLSSQIFVEDRNMSSKTSEGYCLYLWADNDNGAIPSDIWMRAEFNHAGYGRVIPMIAPYKDNNEGFKTNDDIKFDWSDGNVGYGVKRFKRFSYLHFKYMKDPSTGKHVYYLDREQYGPHDINYDTDEGRLTLNINLYEGRISF